MKKSKMETFNLEECLYQYTRMFQDELSKKPLEYYQQAVKEMIEYTGKTLKAITEEDIMFWMHHLEGNGFKPSTIYKKFYAVKHFFNYLRKVGIVSKELTRRVNPPRRESTKMPHWLASEQMEQLREHVNGMMMERALIEMLYSTGMRIGELAALKKEDIDWSRKTIKISNGKGRRRIVFFSPECAKHLIAYLESRSDHLPFVFTNNVGTGQMNLSTVQKKFYSYSKILGFKVTPHILRNTFAVRLFEEQVPFHEIQILLGHLSTNYIQLFVFNSNFRSKDV